MNLVTKEGYRADGRVQENLREIFIEHIIVNNMNTIDYRQGETRILAHRITENKPLPRKGKKEEKLIIEIIERETAFTERKRGENILDEMCEIIKITFNGFISCKDRVRVEVEIIQDDGSLLSSIFNAISLLLCVSGVTVLDLCLSVTIKPYKSWETKKMFYLCDISKSEENSQNSFVIVYAVKRSKILYMNFGKVEFEGIANVYQKSIESIHRIHLFFIDFFKKGKKNLDFLE